MNDKYISLIAKYLSGDLVDREREVLFELVNSSEEHKAYFEEMQNLWEMSGVDTDDVMDVDTHVAWQKVEARIAPTTKVIAPKKSAKRFRLRQLLQVAAVLIGVLIVTFLVLNRETPVELALYETSKNERTEIKLPDGSTVWLNENSTLSYEPNFTPRVITLEGEAFFDVQHLDEDHPFEIQSGDTKTTVLGTSFNVRAYPKEDEVAVTVETGTVVLENKKVKKVAQKVILKAGESGVFKKKELNVRKTEESISNADAWKKQQLVFEEDASIREWVDVLERYFDLEIKVENPKILDCPLGGQYPNPDIDQLIEVLKFSLGIEINQTENTLIFSGKGC